tara:strand:- start:78 stop:437 length:360 start_codon:yes stop_codon:yes gene_type:complete
MDKYLYFATGAPDSGGGDEEVLMIGENNISHFEMANATTLQIFGKEGADQEAQAAGDNNIIITLTVTTGKHKEALQDVAATINGPAHSNGFAVIADSEKSVFCSDFITACASIVVVDAA